MTDFDGFPTPDQEQQEERMDMIEGIILLFGVVLLIGGGVAAFWCITTYLIPTWTLPMR